MGSAAAGRIAVLHCVATHLAVSMSNHSEIVSAHFVPEQQPQDCALAAAAGAHHSTACACRHLEGHSLQYACILAVPVVVARAAQDAGLLLHAAAAAAVVTQNFVNSSSLGHHSPCQSCAVNTVNKHTRSTSALPTPLNHLKHASLNSTSKGPVGTATAPGASCRRGCSLSSANMAPMSMRDCLVSR